MNESKRLTGVEEQSLGIEHFTRDEPSIVRQLQLPDWEDTKRMAFPPAPPSIEMFLPQPLPHSGADWWKDAEAVAAERRAEQERVAGYYAEQTRLQEEREATARKQRA